MMYDSLTNIKAANPKFECEKFVCVCVCVRYKVVRVNLCICVKFVSKICV